VIVGAEVDAPRLVGWIMAAQRVEAGGPQRGAR
jgi:hypothetical protein